MHPLTALSLNNLAFLYKTQGKYAEAERLLLRTLKILEQSVGGEHPNTKHVRKNYAGVLRELGREEEAAALEAEGE